MSTLVAGAPRSSPKPSPIAIGLIALHLLAATIIAPVLARQTTR